MMFSKENIFLVVLSIVFILPMVNFSDGLIYLLWYLAIPLIFVIINLVKKIRKDERVLKEQRKSFSLWMLFLSQFINFCLFQLGLFAIDTFAEKLPRLFSINVLTIYFYVMLIQNVFVTNPGFYFCKIKVSNDSFSEKLRLLILNFYKYFFVYLILFRRKVINQIYIGNDFPLYETSIFIFHFVSFCFRFFPKNYSLMERVLRVEYYKSEVV